MGDNGHLEIGGKCFAVDGTLGDCDAESVPLVFDSATGRLSDADQCITVQERQLGERAATLKLQQCGPLPQPSQQFQFDEITGALRMKSGGCIQSHGDACGLNYRDCCLGVCTAHHDFVV